MPSEDYAAVSSGALKLKSVSASSKIHKHKKKRPKPPPAVAAASEKEAEEKTVTDGHSHNSHGDEHSQVEKVQIRGKGESTGHKEATDAGKTEAERHYQEMRRKRLNDRLKKQGTKTHKERVEDLNRYLNKLSEHHDMPRIGPG